MGNKISYTKLKKLSKMSPAVIVIVVTVSLFAYINQNQNTNNNHNDSGTTANSTTEYVNNDKTLSDVINITKQGIAPNSYIKAKVTYIVDGDTVKVSYDGRKLTVRFLDIDTPESVKRGVSVQSYSKDATEYTTKKCLYKNVKLVFEKGVYDRYSRLLAYVVFEDGSVLNKLLIENGYARVQIISPNTTLKRYFTNLLNNTVKNKRGLWNLPEGECPFVMGSGGEYIPSYY